MLVKCLGSGNAFGAGARFNTSFYIKTSTKGILLDCGASTLIALKREKLETENVDLILITHLHGDHFGGLPFILCEIVALRARRKPLTIIGPEGIKQKTLQALECFYPEVKTDDGPSINFLTYSVRDDLRLDGLHLKAFRAIHSPSTNPHMLRIEVDSRIIAYSGDTEWTEDLIRVSDGADLFICEASSYEPGAIHHLSIKELVRHRSKINAKKIVLTHFGDESLKYLADIPFEVAEDGAVLYTG